MYITSYIYTYWKLRDRVPCMHMHANLKCVNMSSTACVLCNGCMLFSWVQLTLGCLQLSSLLCDCIWCLHYKTAGVGGRWGGIRSFPFTWPYGIDPMCTSDSLTIKSRQQLSTQSLWTACIIHSLTKIGYFLCTWYKHIWPWFGY